MKKWFFCVNARGFEFGLPLIEAAVASARARTRLIPHCIYSGADPRQVARLQAMGVTVIPHVSSFDAELRHGYGTDYPIFDGHWLRVDIPLLERADTYVLYTDIDVMFLGPPQIRHWPRLLAAAPQDERGETRYFNSGVMVLNLPALRRHHAAFVGQIRARLRHGFHYPAHDQESYNRFFAPSWRNRLRRRVVTPLAEVNNWKPYWGLNPEAQIVHFHGPKARDIRVFEQGGGQANQRHLLDLWDRDKFAYGQYASQWEEFSKQASMAVPDL